MPSTQAKRLHFVVPELLQRLPAHMPLAQVLWYSTAALRKVKGFIRRIPHCVIVPTALTWAERRLSNLFNAPMLAPDPVRLSAIVSLWEMRFMSSTHDTPLFTPCPHPWHNLFTPVTLGIPHPPTHLHPPSPTTVTPTHPPTSTPPHLPLSTPLTGDVVTGLDSWYTGYSNSNYAKTNTEYTGSNGQVGANTV